MDIPKIPHAAVRQFEGGISAGPTGDLAAFDRAIHRFLGENPGWELYLPHYDEITGLMDTVILIPA